MHNLRWLFLGLAAGLSLLGLDRARAQSLAQDWAQLRGVSPAHHAAPAAEGLVRASWYGAGERLNRRTASGEIFRPGGFTAAHRTLPFGTRLRVSFNGRSVVVRVNDRGPAARTGRSLDLARGAAQALGLLRQGVGTVRIVRL